MNSLSTYRPDRSASKRPATHIVVLRLVASLLIFITTSLQAGGGTPLSRADKARIEAMLTTEIQRTVDRQKRIEGQAKYIPAKVSIEEDSNGVTLVIDLGKGYIPSHARYFGADMEDLTTELANTVSELVRDVIPIYGVRFLYEGKDIHQLLPDERVFLLQHRKEISREASNVEPSSAAAAGGGRAKVVTSAGHGIY